MQILFSVMMATMMFIMVPRAEVCSERIEEVLDTETSVRLPTNPVTDLSVHGQLEFRPLTSSTQGRRKRCSEGSTLWLPRGDHSHHRGNGER